MILPLMDHETTHIEVTYLKSFRYVPTGNRLPSYKQDNPLLLVHYVVLTIIPRSCWRPKAVVDIQIPDIPVHQIVRYPYKRLTIMIS